MANCPITKHQSGDWLVDISAKISDTGKRRRVRFPTKRQAAEFRDNLLQNLDTKKMGVSLTPGDHNEAIDAIVMLRSAGHKVGFREVATFYLEHHPQESITVEELLARYRESSEMAGLSEIYMRDQRGYHGKLARVIGNEKVAALAPSRLREAMREALSPAASGKKGASPAPNQWNNAVRHYRAAWKWGRTQELLTTDPFTVIKEVKLRRHATEFLTVKEAQALIDACDVESIGYFAIALFAGVRPFELQRLRWEQIDFARGEIIILSANAKTRGGRVIPMEDNLEAILLSIPDKSGLVVPVKNRRKILEAPKRSARLMGRAPDILRHSYATYLMARERDMNTLMAAMGHNIKETSLKHYLGLARSHEADEYFSILPK